MFKAAVCIFLSFLFFAGSTILPQGDFSLMQDLPSMYRSYSRVVTDEEPGLADFIGDYLLGGIELFGHDTSDKSASHPAGINFQHQANPLPVLFSKASPSLTYMVEIKGKAICRKVDNLTAPCSQELYRPPTS